MSEGIRIRFFGRLRREGEPAIVLTAGSLSVSELRQRIAREVLTDPDCGALLAESALATGERVLDETDRVEPGSEIAVLPPVCGG